MPQDICVYDKMCKLLVCYIICILLFYLFKQGKDTKITTRFEIKIDLQTLNEWVKTRVILHVYVMF